VFVERLDWLAKNPRFTQRFAMHVGGLCREMTNTAVAQAERLHDRTVKDLDRIYMQQQVARAGLPAPRAIGVDEIAIRKGHDYRIVVSDLDRRRPIWVGGKGRTFSSPRSICGSPFAPRSSAMHPRRA
jgi:transposase